MGQAPEAGSVGLAYVGVVPKLHNSNCFGHGSFHKGALAADDEELRSVLSISTLQFTKEPS